MAASSPALPLEPLAESKSALDVERERQRALDERPALEKPQSALDDRPALEKHPSLVDWAHDPRNPLCWPASRKLVNCVVTTLNGAACTIAASIIVPANRQVGLAYGETNPELVLLVTTTYLLGQGAGPFVFGPLSELYGRRAAFIASMSGFVVFSIACAVAPNLPALIVLRFIAGAFGSSGPTLGAATIDLYPPPLRGRPVALYSLGPMSGPVIGSLIGAELVLLPTWRWTVRQISRTALTRQLWFMSILGGLTLVSIVCCFSESYGPYIQRRVVAQQDGLDDKSLRPSTRRVIVQAFTRPARMSRNPLLICFSLGLIYIFLVSVPLLFSAAEAQSGLPNYGWGAATWGLAYIVVGFFGAAGTAAIFQNRIYQSMARKNGGEQRPEYRLVLTTIGGAILPLGMLVFGWTANASVHPVGPLFGLALSSYGMMLAFGSVQTFIVDASIPYAAAAVAAASLLRNVLGATLPLAAPSMWKTLGWGWGGTLLAAASVPILPLPMAMFVHGPAMRRRWPFMP